MSQFRFLHLSDFHLSLHPDGSCDLDSLIGVGMHIENCINDLDFVVISGDIVETADKRSLAAAKDFLSGELNAPPLSTGAGVVDRVNTSFSLLNQDLQVSLMPGNHDRMLGEKIRSGSKRFEQYFGKDWNAGNPDQTSARSRASGSEFVKTYSLKKGNENLCLCFADFSLRRTRDTVPLLGSLGKGKVYEDTLAVLDQETKSIKQGHEGTQTAVVWVLHFSPHPAVNFQLSMDNIQAFNDKVVENEVQLVLAGHTHEPHNSWSPRDDLMFQYKDWLFVAGSASAGVKHTTMSNQNSSVTPHSFYDITLEINKSVIAEGTYTEYQRRRLPIPSGYDFCPTSEKSIPIRFKTSP